MKSSYLVFSNISIANLSLVRFTLTILLIENICYFCTIVVEASESIEQNTVLHVCASIETLARSVVVFNKIIFRHPVETLGVVCGDGVCFDQVSEMLCALEWDTILSQIRVVPIHSTHELVNGFGVRIHDHISVCGGVPLNE